MAKKKGADNLKPLNERTTEERRRIAIQGGKASGEARRKNRLLREWAEVFGAQPFKVLNADGSTTDSTYDGAVVASAYKRAIMEQDIRAAEFIAKITGQIESKVKVDADVNGELSTMLSIVDIDPEILAQFITDTQR